MRNTRIGLGAAVATTAVAAMLLGATPAMAQDDDDLAPNRAYGIAASALGEVVIPPTPFVQSEDGEFVEDNEASLEDAVPAAAEAGLIGELLHVEAEEGHAETSVVRFGLRDVFTADLVRTYCDDADGGLELINARFMGKTFATPTVSGQEVDASPVARLRAGHQVRNDDESVTVTGIEITLLPALGDDDEDLTSEELAQLPVLGDALGIELPSTIGNEADLREALTGALSELGLPALDEDGLTIIIGSATCTERGDKDDDGKDDHKDDKDEHKDDDEDKDDDDHDAAPRPAVVDADLAVTG